MFRDNLECSETTQSVQILPRVFGDTMCKLRLLRDNLEYSETLCKNPDYSETTLSVQRQPRVFRDNPECSGTPWAHPECSKDNLEGLETL